MFSKPKLLIVFLVIAFMASTGQAWAGGEKERMRKRLPAIKALKADGTVGENNQGYLTIRKNTAKKKLIEAENRDRREVYRIIAKKQGTKPARVGQRRAIQIAQKATSGTWIQEPNGKWRQR